MFIGMRSSLDFGTFEALLDSDPDWILVFENCSADTDGPFHPNPAFSTGEFDAASESKMVFIIVEVGDYCFGPLTERESVFTKWYA